jgi:hypothetical protein
VIRSIGVEPLFNGACCQSQYLAARGGLDGFEIYAIRGATAQQPIQIKGDVVTSSAASDSFFKSPSVSPLPIRASQIFSSLPPGRL